MYYYLVASLPLLHLDQPPPFTLKDFVFRCQGVLSESDQKDLEAIVDGRSERCASPAGRAWHSLDTQLRNAVARLRATQAGLDARATARAHAGWDGFVEKSVAEAAARTHPLERELALDRCRWRLLDELARARGFDFAAVLAFAAQLQMVERWARMKEETGRQALEAVVSKNLEREGYAIEFEVEVE